VNRLLALGLVIVVAGVVLGSGIVAYSWTDSAANERQGDVQIAAGAYFEVTFRQLDPGAEAVFRIIVEAGPRVDVYVLKDADFLRYVAGLAVVPSPETYVYENVLEVDESPYPSQGVWHVIVDNTDYGVARPAGYTSQVHFLVLGGGTSFGVFFGGLVVSASLVVLGSLVVTRARSRAQTLPLSSAPQRGRF